MPSDKEHFELNIYVNEIQNPFITTPFYYTPVDNKRPNFKLICLLVNNVLWFIETYINMYYKVGPLRGGTQCNLRLHMIFPHVLVKMKNCIWANVLPINKHISLKRVNFWKFGYFSKSELVKRISMGLNFGFLPPKVDRLMNSPDLSCVTISNSSTPPGGKSDRDTMTWSICRYVYHIILSKENFKKYQRSKFRPFLKLSRVILIDKRNYVYEYKYRSIMNIFFKK